jgi:hypothetical protein
MTTTVKYKTSSVRSREVNLDEIAFAVDTALSWDGDFPETGKGDWLVTIGNIDSDPESVLVSRRYTGAGDADNAAKIALNAFAERRGYKSDKHGNVLDVTLEDLGSGPPCWVERVDRVTR